MKVFKLFLLSLFSVFFIDSCSNDNTNDSNGNNNLNPLQYYEALDVSYGENIKQKFDIYLPANRSLNTKVMILVHGGGWSGGDKNEMNGFKDFVQQELPNLGVVNINYRLADANNNPYPMQLNDITAVINHLKTNKENYVIDDNYGFIGVSAGGHLSLLWSYAFDTDSDVNMVCSIVGPTNFTDPAYLNNNDPALQALLDLYGNNADTAFLELASPLYQATATSPPTILFYGGLDPLVPTSQGTTMRDKLEDLNVTYDFTLYPNAGHGWSGLELIDTGIKLKAFTELYLY